MSSMSAADAGIVEKLIKSSLLYGKYEEVIDRESAYEILTAQKSQEDEETQAAQVAKLADKQAKENAKEQAAAARAASRQPKSLTDRMIDKTVNSLEKKAINVFTRTLFGLLRK